MYSYNNRAQRLSKDVKNRTPNQSTVLRRKSERLIYNIQLQRATKNAFCVLANGHFRDSTDLLFTFSYLALFLYEMS